MRLSRLRVTTYLGILSAFCMVPGYRAMAQAPAGPLPPSHPLPPPPPQPPAKKKAEIAPRKTLAGFWKLNADESDDPRQKFMDARKTQGGPNGGQGGSQGGGQGGGMGGPRIGVGGYPYPGGGGPTGPYGGGGGRSGNDESFDQMQDVVQPVNTQDISLRDAEVDSTDEGSNRVIFYTDGRKVQKSDDASRQEVSAHWNGPQLVTDEIGPQKRKVSRTLEIAPDGKQMYETWRIDGRRANSQQVVIRYVYDAAVDNR